MKQSHILPQWGLRGKVVQAAPCYVHLGLPANPGHGATVPSLPLGLAPSLFPLIAEVQRKTKGIYKTHAEYLKVPEMSSRSWEF